MTKPPDPDQLSQAQLLDLVRQLLAENQRLREEIDRLKRGQSPLPPFTRKDRKASPKRAGRKAGQGLFRYRQAPAVPSYSQPPIAVAVTQPHCPACGGRLEPYAQEIVTRTDLPTLPAPQVTAYCVEICRCQRCGKRLRGQHPELPASQRGATAHRLGSRALASAHLLHYQLGIPVRKVPAVLRQLTGLHVTQSALTQAALRVGCEGGALAQEYARLRQQIKEQPLIHTDDTGWSEAGARAYLMVFESPHLSVYQIRKQHRNEEVREVIGETYAGVLTTDRAKSYDAKELQVVKQQKCLVHIQRSLCEVLADKQGPACDFGEALKSQLKEAQALKRQMTAGLLVGKAYERARSELEREINLHLRQRRLSDPDSDGLRRQLLKQHERGNLLRFLHETQVEATNNAAERALRPAVIARKVSQGTKNAKGSRAFEAFTSVIRTAMKQERQSIVESLRQMLERSPPSPAEADSPRVNCQTVLAGG